MVVSLPFIMNLYSDGVFKENPLGYVNFACKVIDDVTFDEHNGYDIMKMIHDDLHPKKHVSHVDSDSDADKNHTLDDVAHIVEDFEHEDDGNVNIPRITTDDPRLNKLVGNGNYIGQTNNPNGLQDNFLLEVEYTDDEQFESQQQLKHMLANDVVQHGYKLWYMHNDHNKVLVLCGRDVNKGKCAGYKGKKPKEVDSDQFKSSKQGSKKKYDGKKPKQVNEKISKTSKDSWAKKKEHDNKMVSKQGHCLFMLNYTLGALVTYKWIAQQYVRGYDDVSLKVGVDLPTQESTVAAKPKPTRSKKSKPT
ncbi:hypothetical protein Tco_0518336 [Tanacetum coccineum]